MRTFKCVLQNKGFPDDCMLHMTQPGSQKSALSKQANMQDPTLSGGHWSNLKPFPGYLGPGDQTACISRNMFRHISLLKHSRRPPRVKVSLHRAPECSDCLDIGIHPSLFPLGLTRVCVHLFSCAKRIRVVRRVQNSLQNWRNWG